MLRTLQTVRQSHQKEVASCGPVGSTVALRPGFPKLGGPATFPHLCPSSVMSQKGSRLLRIWEFCLKKMRARKLMSLGPPVIEVGLERGTQEG